VVAHHRAAAQPGSNKEGDMESTTSAGSAAGAAKTRPAGCPMDHGYQPFDLTDPFLAYRNLRSEAPVAFDNRIGYWVVSRYAEIKAVFEDWETFSSENAQKPVRSVGTPARKVMDEGGFTAYSGLSARVPPEHTRIRKIATKAFTPRRYRALEAQIRGNVDTMLAAMTAKPTPGDLVADLAWDLPTITVLTLLGVPADRIPQVKEWAVSRSAMTWGDLTDEEQVPHAHNLVSYWQFCQDLVDKRHREPGDDLVSDVVRLQSEGHQISDHEIASFCYSLLFAGHETTTTLIANTLRELLSHPAQWKQLIEDPAKIPGAVDEVLRYSPSIVAWRRKALRDARVGGVDIPAGAELLLLMGSANRDEKVFADPEAFDITRANARSHLAFGFGIHYCLGNQLAKQQVRIVLERTTSQLPSLRLVAGQQIEFAPNLSFRTPKSVLVEWED
jgi:cytochrome P450